MCIIAIKPANKPLPTLSTFETCFEENPHGAGVMVSTGTSIQIHKGMMKFSDFKKCYHRLDAYKQHAMVFHFRIATHGAIGEGLTHPFPVTNSAKLLTATKSSAQYGFAHNGILSRVRSDDKLSDSAVYVKDFLSKIKLDDKGLVQYFLDSTCESSRFVLLYPDGQFVKSGSWITDNGIYWSNDSYKKAEWAEYHKDWFSFTYKGNKKKDKKKDPALVPLPFGRKVYDDSGNVYWQGMASLLDDEQLYQDTITGELWVIDHVKDTRDFIGYAETMDYAFSRDPWEGWNPGDE
jgi:glutamine amidotransferase